MKSKIKKNSNENEFFSQLLDSVPEATKKSVSISMAIASQLNFVLKQKNLSQRNFAELLGKKESEISKWLSGTHNFTTNTIGKIESVLDVQIVNCPIYTKKEIKLVTTHEYTNPLISAGPGTIEINLLKLSHATSVNQIKNIESLSNEFATRTFH